MLILALATGLLGFVGIVGASAQYTGSRARAEMPIVQEMTGPPTIPVTPSPLTATPILIPTGSLLFPASTTTSELIPYVQAPSGFVSKPYVILSAFSYYPHQITMRGLLNSQEFFCPASPCILSLESSSSLVFRATDESGNSGSEVFATVNVVQKLEGYLVTINQVSQYTSFKDSCSLAWGIQDESGATWDNFYQSPYEFSTKKTLHRLVTKLILNGIVDANSCPAGGLSIGLDWPTACGIERSTQKMIEWQNQYDPAIWFASREIGIPPKVLKSLIEIESQYWPENGRFYVDEYGLGQINQLGVDILLRNDIDFYRQVCTGVFSDCSVPYLSLSPPQQALIRGAAVRLADVSCDTCPYGIDLNKAQDSVSLIARLLRANCQQVKVVLRSASVKFADPDADAATATAAVATALAENSNYSTSTYEDLWRFAFASYHSGISCFQEAVNATKKEGQTPTWENVSKHFKCKGGVTYADGFMNILKSFDTYLYQPGPEQLANVAQASSPTRVPIATPTMYTSSATLIVQVYLDRNGNGSPDSDEGIDAMTIQVSAGGSEPIVQRTANGIAIFDMSRFQPGVGVSVILPGLYRSETLVLPEQGEVTITFKFEVPPLPTNLP